MTVAVQQPFNLYGPVTPGAVLFTFDFKITTAADLVVTVNDGAPLESGIDYTVTGVGNNDGGDIRLSIGLSGGQMVLLKRQMSLDRETDYQQNGDFLSPTVNNDFDRIWLALQQFAQDLKRSFKLPFATFTNQELTQTPAQRAGKAVVFDANGNMSIGADNYNDQAAAAAASAAEAGNKADAANSAAQGAATAAAQAAASAALINPENFTPQRGGSHGASIIPSGPAAARPPAVEGEAQIRYSDEGQTFEGRKGAGPWGPIGGGATGAPGNPVFYLNAQIVTGDYTIPVGFHAGTFGDISIAAGKTVTISEGSQWVMA